MGEILEKLLSCIEVSVCHGLNSGFAWGNRSSNP